MIHERLLCLCGISQVGGAQTDRHAAMSTHERANQVQNRATLEAFTSFWRTCPICAFVHRFLALGGSAARCVRRWCTVMCCHSKFIALICNTVSERLAASPSTYTRTGRERQHRFARRVCLNLFRCACLCLCLQSVSVWGAIAQHSIAR